MRELLNGKIKAWSAVGARYWSGTYYGGPGPRDVRALLAGTAGCDRVAVVGASTVELADAAIARAEQVHVLDFSPYMLSVLPSRAQCITTLHDITASLPEVDRARHDLVVADRLLNRFSANELELALAGLHDLLKVGGTLRTTVRFGLYARDLSLLAACREPEIDSRLFDPVTREIDYGAMSEQLAHHLPAHGDIPHRLLLEFYRARGREKRLSLSDVEECLRQLRHGSRTFILESVEPCRDTSADHILILRRSTTAVSP